ALPMYMREAGGGGVEHGPAQITRKSVPRQPDHIDITGAVRNFVRQDPGPHIDQLQHAALNDFAFVDSALRNAALRSQLLNNQTDLRVFHTAARAALITVETRARLLAEASELGQTIGNNTVRIEPGLPLEQVLAHRRTDIPRE